MSVIGPVQSHYHEGSPVGNRSLRWEGFRLSSKDCWSAPCTCCVESRCFKSVFNLHLVVCLHR